MTPESGSNVDTPAGSPAELWRHPDPASTSMWAFLRRVDDKYGLGLEDYQGLYRWSIENVADFWAEVWDFVGIAASVRYEKVLPSTTMYPRPDFMHGARLNYAQNLLFPPSMPHSPAPSPGSAALISVTETGGPAAATSWASLRDAVRRCSVSLRAAGLRPDDVVAGLVANHEQALVFMLSAAAVGAAWTALSPDTGASAVLDRYAQIRPKVLVVDDGAVYNGKNWPGTKKAREVVGALAPLGLELVVTVPVLGGTEGELAGLSQLGVHSVEYEEFLNRTPEDAPLVFEQLPPSHPLYILYSSGTTGLPKAIVHTALGTLLQHKKEHDLHCSMSSSSRLLYYTTTSWMMWHWSVSALAVGATLVLYAGSPFRPHLSMARIVSDLRVTHFGTSAAYLTVLETKQEYPVRDPALDLSALVAIYSTASPLPPSTFRYVYDAFPARTNLASITGGTDIISLFGAPCPLLPVRVGEIQCAGLGMAVKAVDPDTGEEVAPGEPGDLVCVRPFPSQPLTFFGNGGEARYRAAYFERFDGPVAGVRGPVWHHGDFVRMPDRGTGSLVMLGRSDGVLKPSGVRFGSAEIYNILTRFFAAVVEDAVCVGRRRETDRDETVCLFVVLAGGRVLDDKLRGRIKDVIRTELSPRHVPGVIEVCSGVPRTGNGKIIEVAVKQILSDIETKKNTSVANPEALEWFREWARTH